MNHVDVLPLSHCLRKLTYEVCPSQKVQKGEWVGIHIRKQQTAGIILEKVPKPSFLCKPISYVSRKEDQIILSKLEEKLFNWMQSYYLLEPTQALQALFPSSLPDLIWNPISPQIPTLPPSHLQKPPHKLRLDQEKTLQAFLKGSMQTYLLHSPMGSGKTEIYLWATYETLLKGKDVILLVPEVSLTNQLFQRFQDVFPHHLISWHSGAKGSKSKQLEKWQNIRQHSPHVILGVRSALFAPCSRLGLIIVDEEQDPSYKMHEQKLTLQIRDVAVMKAHFAQAKCLLGSATPSLESFLNVQKGLYHLLPPMKKHHTSRICFQGIDAKKDLVSFQIQKQPKKKKMQMNLIQEDQNQDSSHLVHFPKGVISQQIIEELQKTKEKGAQSLILMNRRGSAHFLLCLNCGFIPKCHHCDTVLTYFAGQEDLKCKRCGAKQKRTKECPKCHHKSLVTSGAGTERMLEDLIKACPNLTFELVESQKKTHLVKAWEKFRKQEVDALIGTQILSKGHDFPQVQLMVLLHLEDQFHLPDPRTLERLIQLFTQASGRVGRQSHTESKVLYQTWQLDHPIYQIARGQSYETFLKEELQRRWLFRLPPVFRDYLIHFQGRDRDQTKENAQTFYQICLNFFQEKNYLSHQIQIYEPFPALISKIKNQYRFQVRLSSLKVFSPHHLIPYELREKLKKHCGSFFIDVDPYDYS